jgi:hypothetical protein
MLNKLDEVQECPDIHRGFASLNDSCHENRTMNGASQPKPNQGYKAGNHIKDTNLKSSEGVPSE